jgi:hypothetical protein
MNEKPLECLTPLSDALDALLAYRHGDTKHLTREHARLLYERLRDSEVR